MERELAGKIHEEGLDGKVVLLGNVPSSVLGAYFEACDVFCLPSTEKAEAFGVVLLEAMHFGKPIVATQIPGSGVDWVNRHGETGYNVPRRDPGALAGALQAICSDPELCARMSRNAVERKRGGFLRAHMGSGVLEVYRRVCSGEEPEREAVGAGGRKMNQQSRDVGSW
jgi:rhamnosyl/mannosyltransferase